jgi:hypothetical protein
MFEMTMWTLVVVLGLMIVGTAGLLAIARKVMPGRVTPVEAAGDPYTSAEDRATMR